MLNDMFRKRKTVALKYDEALEALGGDERRLKHLIEYGVIVRTDDALELEDVYQRFFEEVLAVNEDINVASVQTYISKLELGIDSYLMAENAARKSKLVREIRHTLKSIEKVTHRNVVDLKRNVDDTYKQEPDFKIKELRLRDFDKKAETIKELIRQTEKVIDGQPVFFANAMDNGMKQTVGEVKAGLRESAHGLIAVTGQIIDYLHKIEYQSVLVKKIRQLKYFMDQFMIEDDTDVKTVLSQTSPVWMEKQPKYVTRVSLDFLRNDDAALEILDDVRRRLSRKAGVKERMAGKIDKQYLDMMEETNTVVNHREVMNGFLAQGRDLFSYVWNYGLPQDAAAETRLVLFLQLVSQYEAELEFTPETGVINNIEYPKIYPK